MRKLGKSNEVTEPRVEARAPWQKPAVTRMWAGMAEVGFTNTVDDGPGTKS